MTVCVDSNALYTSRAGIARYVSGLLDGLARVDGLSFRTLAWRVENFGFRQPGRALRTFYRECIWARLVAPREITDSGSKVFHSTSLPLVRPPRNMPHVVTLHDLAAITCPKRFRSWQAVSGVRRLRQLHSADKIICISEFTAREAMRLLQIPASKLEVIHNGSGIVGSDSPPEMPPEISVPSEFFLFVGSLEPGKNLALLRQSYLLAEQSGRSLPPLMVVGSRWPGTVGEGKPPAGWHYLGHQPDETLVFLYRRALGLLFPSKYEGFGLPIVEAMACGCPVICSRVTSLPEVGGEAALYAEQTPTAYLEAMIHLQTGAGVREDLIERGQKQAAFFSWERCALATADVYRSV